MQALAVIIEAPERLSLRPLALQPLGPDDLLIEIAWSGISAGTEKLFWTGRMPAFPGMSYPLVPGYESVGRVTDAGANARGRIGEWVFVPGARCFRDAHGLFGGAAQRVVTPAARALPVAESLGEQGVLVALAATAFHALAGGEAPDLIVGHGVLGRLLARVAIARGASAPTIWEIDPARRDGAGVIHPATDERRDYRSIYDVSGHGAGLDGLIGRLGRGGEIVLAGFYQDPLAFAFAPAFQREARLRVAAEWQPGDLAEVLAMIAEGRLDLSGLISDVRPAEEAGEAYPYALGDSRCLKMALDWRGWA
ncbi:MAG TPA: chlorophyll synthesis pathway protein BchC [Allosphingosinicella sp.]|jgi:3-hydroxyethyl bacteriochlorophyllide a dehydrogenase